MDKDKKMFCVLLPKDKHYKIKLFCSMNNMKMKDLLIQFIDGLNVEK